MMDEPKIGMLLNLRVLIVEDEQLVALALAGDLEDAGAIVVGPASTVEDALGLIGAHEIEAAVLDIQLQSQFVFPVAEELVARGVPFMFTTGFDAGILPAEYVDVPKCEKPASPGTVLALLAQLARPAAN